MKKIMLGVLVIIPIIIMLIVGLVTSFVSTQAYIGVESVSIDEDVVRIMFSEVPLDENGRKVVDLDNYMTVTVLPERAQNKTVEWQIDKTSLESSDPEMPGAQLVDVDGGTYTPVDSNTSGLVEFTAYCTFRVSVTAEGHSDDVIVEVTDADVESITLIGENSLTTGEKTMLSPVYTPAGSIVTAGRWHSSDESVATVDANGIVTAVGEGEAVITMSARKDKAAEAAEDAESEDLWVSSEGFVVAVTRGVSSFGDTVHTVSRTVRLADVGIADASAKEGCTVSDGVLTIDGGVSRAVVSTAGGDVTFIVCGEDDFVIADAEFFGYDEDAEIPHALGIGEIPLDLDAVSLADIGGQTGELAAEWSSSAPDVATVDENGVVTAISEGETEIRATYAGVTQSVVLRVVSKISIFRLALDDSSLRVGLARETVFAAYRFDPDADVSDPAAYESGMTYFVDNVFGIEIALPAPPTDEEEAAGFYDDFVFEVDKTDIAHFEGNMLVFNAENITERTDITVKVSARYPRNASVAAQTLTLTVIPAVEVNDANEFFVAARATQYFNKYKSDGLDDFDWVYEDREPAYDGDIVLGSDIAYCDLETGEPLITVYEEKKAQLQVEPYEAEICCSLYGNNHIIYACRSFMVAYNGALVIVREQDAVVSNVTITPNYDIGDEITNAEGAQGLKGYALHMRTLGQHSNMATHDPNQEFVNGDLTVCRVEYSILQNASSGLGLHGVDCTLDGVVIRNTGGTGIYVPTSIDRVCDQQLESTPGDVKYSILRTHNVTMSNMIGTGMSFHFNRFSDRNEEYMGAATDPATGKKYYELALEKGYKSQFIQTGYLDIYNWQPIDNLSLLDTSSMGSAGGLVSAVMGSLGEILANPESDFTMYVKHYAGTEYVHFGFVSTGLTERSYLEPEFEDDRFTELTTEDIPGLGAVLNASNAVRVWCYTTDETAIQPGTTYTINNRFIDRMHAD